VAGAAFIDGKNPLQSNPPATSNALTLVRRFLFLMSIILKLVCPFPSMRRGNLTTRKLPKTNILTELAAANYKYCIFLLIAAIANSSQQWLP
jgi:hypothetical protein